MTRRCDRACFGRSAARVSSRARSRYAACPRDQDALFGSNGDAVVADADPRHGPVEMRPSTAANSHRSCKPAADIQHQTPPREPAGTPQVDGDGSVVRALKDVGSAADRRSPAAAPELRMEMRNHGDRRRRRSRWRADEHACSGRCQNAHRERESASNHPRQKGAKTSKYRTIHRGGQRSVPRQRPTSLEQGGAIGRVLGVARGNQVRIGRVQPACGERWW